MSRAEAQRLARRLLSLKEARQRVAVLAEEAARRDLHGFVDLLASLIARGVVATTDGDRIAMMTLVDYLGSEHVDDEMKEALREASRARCHDELLDLLAAPPPMRSTEESRVPDYDKGRTLTLGERKALARRPSRDVLERVMSDPHPAVIHNLLANPRLTEQDVVRLASRRPNQPEVLGEIYRSSRWIRQYHVQLALVRNPYTPTELALKLLPLLLRQDLREVEQATELHPDVRHTALRILDGAAGSSSGEPGDDAEDDEDDRGPWLH